MVISYTPPFKRVWDFLVKNPVAATGSVGRNQLCATLASDDTKTPWESVEVSEVLALVKAMKSKDGIGGKLGTANVKKKGWAFRV